MSTVTVRSEYKRAIAECKRLRSTGMCERRCDCWHPNWRGKYPPFCKSAMSKEKGRR